MITSNNSRRWMYVVSNTIIELSPEAQMALTWAHKKMQEEERLAQLMVQYPGLQDLHDRFQVMLQLIQQDESKID